MGKITRFVKVGFDEEEFGELLMQAHDDMRDPSGVLKVLWLRDHRARLAAEAQQDQQSLREFGGRSGPQSAAGNRGASLGNAFKDTEQDAD